jgi:hypothetical protein
MLFFWDVTPCCCVSVSRSFEASYCLRLQESSCQVILEEFLGLLDIADEGTTIVVNAGDHSPNDTP